MNTISRKDLIERVAEDQQLGPRDYIGLERKGLNALCVDRKALRTDGKYVL